MKNLELEQSDIWDALASVSYYRNFQMQSIETIKEECEGHGLKADPLVRPFSEQIERLTKLMDKLEAAYHADEEG